MHMNDAVARSLKDIGVKTLFGLIGDANLFIVDRFVRDGGHYVSAAHEVSAVLMALGYALVSGEVGVATVTCGPGLTNTITALVEGVRGHIPMVLITGDGPSKAKYHPQNISQREFVQAAGAGFETSARVEDVCRDLVYAFQRALAEHRPIVFNLPPLDHQWDDIGDYQRPHLVVPQRHAEAIDGPELEAAVGILASAKRPIVVAGYGVVKSGQADQVLQLARRLDAPIMTTLRAKDLYRDDPLNLGVLGISGRMEAMDAVTVSDCVVAFGAGLNMFTTGHGAFLKGKRVIMVTSDRFSIGRHVTADATVLGDLGPVADRMAYWLDEAEIPPSQFASEARVKSAVAAIANPESDGGATGAGALRIQDVMVAINNMVERKRILVTDGGRFMRQPWQTIQVTEPRYFVSTQFFGAIGTAMGYAVGAAHADRALPTIVISGDGGFMLGGLAEFNTAVRHGLDMIVFLCNDGGYGAEYLHFTDHNLDPALALFDWPGFADVARSLGGEGYTVRTADDLDGARQLILQRSRHKPILIDIKLDPKTMPRTF